MNFANNASKMISVKQVWIRFPPGFNKFDDFYKSLGHDIPQLCRYDGGVGIEQIYCIGKDTEIEKICKNYKITLFTTCDFMTEESKFNNKYQILPNSNWRDKTVQPYKLEKFRE